jgi:WD40 repeat protein/class 3 adenylate cyclase/tRNA A-37 threonylcarbamoyl transferase component Bud32
MAEPPAQARANGWATDPKRRSGLITVLFTDMVGSAALKQRLGDRASSVFFDQHHRIIRETLSKFAGGEEIETAGDSFLISFGTPSDAIQFALLTQSRLGVLAAEQNVSALDRIGIFVGEVVIKENETGAKPRDLFGIPIDICARIMSLATGGQTLMSRFAFDAARPMLRGDEFGALQWLNHGPYLLKGIEEPIEICEVRAAGSSASPPTSNEKATRVSTDGNLVLGWRPALEQLVPTTRWKLIEKLGEGGFGEVWLGQHEVLKEKRVFKFCFQAERVRSLKRELTLFRILKEKVGEHPNIAAIREVNFDTAPFYIEMDYVAGHDLKAWFEAQSAASVSEAEKLEIMVQIADALQAAHQCGIVHRDVKPGNILISNSKPITAKLTDFGIGQVLSEEHLFGMTRAGFTQTMMGSSTSGTGTQMYIAPEILAGKPASTRSDIYSLGVVLYQLLIGDFTQSITIDWARRIEDPLLRDDLEKCFAGNPNERFGSAAELAKSLRTLSERRSELERTKAQSALRERAAYRRGVMRTAGLGAVIAMLLASLAIFALHQSRKAEATAARETAQRRRADNESERANQNLYDADMSLAQHGWVDGNLGSARNLLAAHQPQAGELDRRGFEWFYLWNLCRGDQRITLTNHSEEVISVAFSPDGKVLATASAWDPVHIWDGVSGKFLKTLPEQNVISLAFAPGGQMLGVGSRDRVVVRNLQSGEIVFKREEAKGEFRISFSSSANLMLIGRHGAIIGQNGGGAELWDYVSGELKRVLPESGGHVAFSPRGNRLATGNWNGTIKIWDAASGQLLSILKSGQALAMAFSPDGLTLATSDWDSSVRLWDGTTGKEIGSLTNIHHRIWALAFSPAANVLATGGADQTVGLWDVATFRQLERLQGHGNEVMSVAFSPDGQEIASGSKDRTARLWNIHPVRTATIITNVLKRPIFSPDGQTVAAGIGQNKVAAWDVATLQLKAVFDGAADAVAFSTNGNSLIARGTNYFLKTYNIADQSIRETISGEPLIEDTFNVVAFSPDRKTLVASYSDGSLMFFDPKTGLMTAHAAQTGVPRIFQLCFSPNGKLVASAGRSSEPRIWDVATHKLVAAPTGHTQPVLSLGFSPDGENLVSCGADNSIRFWNTTSWKEIAPSLEQKEYVSALAISPDGRTLASACNDGSLKLWNAATRRELASLDPGMYGFYITFSPDGRTLAAWDHESLRLWRAPANKEEFP